jgi:hypothetical protein
MPDGHVSGDPLSPKEPTEPIFINQGALVRLDGELPEGSIAGWSIVEIDGEGRVGVSAMYRGEEHARYTTITFEAYLRSRPRSLRGQQVRHPAPPDGVPAPGWVVEFADPVFVGGELVEPADTSNLVLVRGPTRGTAALDDVIRANLDELQSRIEFVRDT